MFPAYELLVTVTTVPTPAHVTYGAYMTLSVLLKGLNNEVPKRTEELGRSN